MRYLTTTTAISSSTLAFAVHDIMTAPLHSEREILLREIPKVLKSEYDVSDKHGQAIMSYFLTVDTLELKNFYQVLAHGGAMAHQTVSDLKFIAQGVGFNAVRSAVGSKTLSSAELKGAMN